MRYVVFPALQPRFIVRVALFCLLGALVSPAQSVATFSQRSQVVLNAVPPTAAAIENGHPIQFQLWATESLYLKGIDSEAKTVLLNALPQMHEPATPTDDSFNLIAAVDVLERWSSHFSPNPDPNPSQNLSAVFQSTLTGFPYWNGASTSNQLLMAAVARYLTYEKYPTATFASNFAANDPNARTYLLCIMQQFATHNLQEHDSDVYTGAYLTSFRLLADYAQDTTIRQAAQMTYDWLLVNTASTWMNSTWAATSYRRYFDIAPQNQMETGSWTLWPLFGGPLPGSGFNVELMQGAIQTIATCACVSGLVAEDGKPYAPRQEIMDLLNWTASSTSPASYEFKARTYTPSRPTYQYMQDSYITANYALFGETDFETSSGTKLALQPPAQVLSGVVWNPSSANANYPSNFYAGAPRWQIDFSPTSPTGCPDSSNDCAASNHTFGFGQHGQYFQNGNAQLAVYNYNITTAEPEPNQFYIYAPLCTNNQYPYTFPSGSTIPNFPCTTAVVPRAMITREASTVGHLYLYYDNVLISLWLSAPFTWDGLHELSAYDPSALNAHSLLASALEVASPADFAGATDAATLANFQAYVDSHAVFDVSGLSGTNPYAIYTTSKGVVMKNVFQQQNYINGGTVDYTTWPLMQTPWVQQNWLSTVACVSCYAGLSYTYTIGGGGNLTVTSPLTGNQLIYDFTANTITELLAQTISFPALPTPVISNTAVTLAATASSGLPVSYAVTGPATLTGSTLTYTAPGTVMVTATQAGNSSYVAAPVVSQTIHVVNATTTILRTAPSTPLFGDAVTLTATITPVAGSAAPTGAVSFYDGATLLGTGTISAGVATYSISSLSVATHTLTAVYGGDGNYASSTSPAVSFTIAAAQSSLTIAASPTHPTLGNMVTLTATLTPTSSVYTGETITFYEGSTILGTGTLSSTGSTTFATASFPIGTHNIAAQYNGDTDYAPAITAMAAQVVVVPLATTLSLAATPGTIAIGGSVSITATVTATTGSVVPSGSVAFFDNGSSLGSSALNVSGVARFTTTALTAGSHTLTASFAANGNFGGSSSQQSVTVVVTPAPDYSATISSSSLTISPGSTATPTITVTPLYGYTGTVTLSCGQGLPANIVCTIAPRTLSFLPSSAIPQTAALSVTAAATQSSLRRLAPTFACLLWIPGLFALVLRRRQTFIVTLLLLISVGMLAGCGSKSTTSPSNYTTSVVITDGTNNHSLQLAIMIQ
jgi:hypothetical protein